MNVMAANKARLLVIFCAFIAISSSQQEYTCPPAATSGYVYRSSCYDFVNKELTWTNARLQCRNRGGRLVMVTDANLQAWLSSTASGLFPGRQGVWLGLHDRRTEGVFYWDNYDGNDQVATYFNWAAGEPNNQFGTQDCTYMRRLYFWKWVDVECNLPPFRTYVHICEFRGIVRVSPTSTRLRTTESLLSSPASVQGLSLSSQPATLSSSEQFTAIAATEEENNLAGEPLDNRHDMTDRLPGQSGYTAPPTVPSLEPVPTVDMPSVTTDLVFNSSTLLQQTSETGREVSGQSGYAVPPTIPSLEPVPAVDMPSVTTAHVFNSSTRLQLTSATCREVSGQSGYAVPPTIPSLEPVPAVDLPSVTTAHVFNSSTRLQLTSATCREVSAEAALYSKSDGEALDAGHQSQTVHVIIAVVVILAIGIPVIVFFLMRRRRRLQQPKDGNVTSTVLYSTTGVRGLENPMYCSPNALFADSTASPLLNGSAGDEQRLPTGGTVAYTPAFNVYTDMDALARGSQDSLHQYESANGNPIYAEPFHDCRGTLGGSRNGEQTGSSTLSTQPPPVYAECKPLESELNDLSKDCHPDRQSSGGFGELKLNLDDNGEATASGSGEYEEYKSQWNAYENSEKPGGQPHASS